MSSRAKTDFKNALQSLTTLVVKAEAAQGGAEEVFAKLRDEAYVEWRRVLATRDALPPASPDSPLPHSGWYDKTIARAEALFGALPAETPST